MRSSPTLRHDLQPATWTSPQSSNLTRRQFVWAGAIGGGLSLSSLLAAEAQAAKTNSRKSIINIHLDGGAPQMDLIDPKPLAPIEIRGPLDTIRTNVPGIQLTELLPQIAQRADRITFIRSLVGSAGAHDAFQCQSGFDSKSLQPLGGRPAVGCVLQKLLSQPADASPAFIDLMQGRGLVRNSARPGFLGPSYQPFRPDLSELFARELEAGMVKELERRGSNHSVALALSEELTDERLSARTQLLSGLDRLRRQSDKSGMMDALDAFQQQAVGILTSGQLARALDLQTEDPHVLARYTISQPTASVDVTTSDQANATYKFLLARRLIEVGARCVSISISDFDTHSNNFPRLKYLMPIVDHGLATLIDDLTQRGLWDDVAIVVWGEFGRTPIINSKNGGRDHWPAVAPCLLMGGKIPGGTVIGSTDRTAGHATSQPVTHKDVFATLYQHLGINPRRVTLPDPTGRPQYLLDEGEPITNLANT